MVDAANTIDAPMTYGIMLFLYCAFSSSDAFVIYLIPIIPKAITDTKLEELTREVRLHNNFAQRVPILEEKVKNLEKRREM